MGFLLGAVSLSGDTAIRYMHQRFSQLSVSPPGHTDRKKRLESTKALFTHRGAASIMGLGTTRRSMDTNTMEHG